MIAMFAEKDRKIELLMAKYSEVAALKRQFEVRTISTYKVFLTQTSWESQLLRSFTLYPCESPSHLS
jgi:hypothetical protein